MAKRVLSISRFRSAAGSAEAVAEIVDAERGEVVGRQRLQRELGRPARDGEASLLAVPRKLDIGALGQLAHDVVEHMGGHGGGAFALGRTGTVSTSSMSRSVAVSFSSFLAAATQDIGQDGDGVAALHHARHMGERLGKAGFVDGEPHGCPIPKKVNDSRR